MATKPFIAEKGLLCQLLGSASSLAIAAPLVDGSRNEAALTDASRIGFYWSRESSAEKIGAIVLGTERLAISVAGAAVTGATTLTQGTITAATPVLSGTATWNSSGTTFTAYKLNVTDTASASASLLLDLQVGGVSKCQVSKAGIAYLTAVDALIPASGSVAGVYVHGSVGGKASGDYNAADIYVASGAAGSTAPVNIRAVNSAIEVNSAAAQIESVSCIDATVSCSGLGAVPSSRGLYASYISATTVDTTSGTAVGLQIGAPASLGYFGVETYANSGTPSDQAAYGILIEGFVRCEIGHASGIHVPDGVVQLTGGTGDAVTAWLGTPTNGGTGKALSLYASGPVEIAGSVLLSGSMTTAIRSIATTGGTTDALDSDHVLDFTGTSVHTYNLPACSAGRELDIHNSSTGQVTLNLNGSDTQNGVAVDIILTANQGVRLVGNGTNWTVR